MNTLLATEIEPSLLSCNHLACIKGEKLFASICASVPNRLIQLDTELRCVVYFVSSPSSQVVIAESTMIPVDDPGNGYSYYACTLWEGSKEVSPLFTSHNYFEEYDGRQVRVFAYQVFLTRKNSPFKIGLQPGSEVLYKSAVYTFQSPIAKAEVSI